MALQGPLEVRWLNRVLEKRKRRRAAALQRSLARLDIMAHVAGATGRLALAVSFAEREAGSERI